LLAFAQTDLPMVMWTDGTFRRMQDFYPYYKNLCAETLRSGLLMNETLVRRCRLAIYSSDWAAQSAQAQYQLDPARVKVVPFGANLECQRTSREVANLIAARPPSPVKLLFIGRIWERKGGDVALAVVRQLNESGTPAELTLVGSGPENPAALPACVKPLGFISKATVAGRKQLDRLFEASHFLIVPSRAEAYGIVFCEASSFGLPSLATRIGGIPTIIREGVNGRTFPLDAPVSDYCEFITGLMRNYAQYRHLAMNAFGEYERRLNWRVAAQTVKALLEEVAETHR
jgi:glycosyltransferase involved in cell wall biosynthesis